MSLRFIIALWDKNIPLNMVNFEMLLVFFCCFQQGHFSLLLKDCVLILDSKKYFEKCSSPVYAIVRGPISHLGQVYSLKMVLTLAVNLCAGGMPCSVPRVGSLQGAFKLVISHMHAVNTSCFRLAFRSLNKITGVGFLLAKLAICHLLW